MTAATSRSLTERQQAVMERIDRRVPIKVIAQEMGVSETRVNQHIRALKDIFSAESLNELVEIYREELDDPGAERSEGPFSESVYTKNQVPAGALISEGGFRVDPGELVFSDVLPMDHLAAWERPSEPRIVPGVLDGENAVLMRFAAIVGIAFGILAAVILAVTATVTISEALDGKAAIPADYSQPAD